MKVTRLAAIAALCIAAMAAFTPAQAGNGAGAGGHFWNGPTGGR